MIVSNLWKNSWGHKFVDDQQIVEDHKFVRLEQLGIFLNDKMILTFSDFAYPYIAELNFQEMRIAVRLNKRGLDSIPHKNSFFFDDEVIRSEFPDEVSIKVNMPQQGVLF